MQTTLAVTALMMGLVGGPHCVAMCGAACGAISRNHGRTDVKAMWSFQIGRLFGYALLGSFAAMSMQGLGWLSTQSSILRPVWSMFHIAIILLGAVLIYQARQPIWFEVAARRVWSKVRQATDQKQLNAPLLIGALWSLMPCGLLYSALLVATLTHSAAEGAGTMALFAAGSSVSLIVGPWFWSRFYKQSNGSSAIRIAGLALVATSGWSLWMGLMHNTAPWCVSG